MNNCGVKLDEFPPFSGDFQHPSNVTFSESMDDPLWTAGVTAGGGSVECAATFMDKYLPARVCGRGGWEAGDRVARLSGGWLSRAALLCG